MTTFTETLYPLGQPGFLGSDEWFEWTESAPVTVSFQSGLAVKSIWFPSPMGQMSFYAGPSATGTPFYVTDGSVPELVAIPNDAVEVTIAGTGSATIWVYASTAAFPPFRASAAPFFDIMVTPPITNSGTGTAPILGLTIPLPIAYGGTGDTNPSLEAGSNITISGQWPNQTISASTGAGGIQSISVNPPLSSTGGQNPTLSLQNPLLVNYGGTGTSNPYLEGDSSGIFVNGADNVQDATFQWTVTLQQFLGDNSNALINGPGQLTQAGGIVVSKQSAHVIKLDTTALVPVSGGITSTGGSLTVTPHVGSQSVNLEVATPPTPVYAPGGSALSSPHIVRSGGGAYSVSWTNNTIGSTTIALSGGAAFSSASSYAVTIMVQGVTGGASPPVFVLEANPTSGSSISVTGYGNGGSGSGTINFDIIAVGQ